MKRLSRRGALAALVTASAFMRAGAVQPLIDPDTGRPDFIGLKLGRRGGAIPPVGPAAPAPGTASGTCAESHGYSVCLRPRDLAGSYVLEGVLDGQPWRAFFVMQEDLLVVVGEGFDAVSDGGPLVFKRASGVTPTTLRLLDAFAILVRLDAGESR